MTSPGRASAIAALNSDAIRPRVRKWFCRSRQNRMASLSCSCVLRVGFWMVISDAFRVFWLRAIPHGRRSV